MLIKAVLTDGITSSYRLRQAQADIILRRFLLQRIIGIIILLWLLVFVFECLEYVAPVVLQ